MNSIDGRHRDARNEHPVPVSKSDIQWIGPAPIGQLRQSFHKDQLKHVKVIRAHTCEGHPIEALPFCYVVGGRALIT